MPIDSTTTILRLELIPYWSMVCRLKHERLITVTSIERSRIIGKGDFDSQLI